MAQARDQDRFYPKEGGFARDQPLQANRFRPKEGGLSQFTRYAQPKDAYFDHLYNDGQKRWDPSWNNGVIAFPRIDSDTDQPPSTAALLTDEQDFERKTSSTRAPEEAAWDLHDPHWYASINKEPERGKWSGKTDFLMSMIAYAVGLGNVWRFPYLCYENGGGAFFVPYFLCWMLAATPIFFMEVSVGQFLGQGGVSVWKLCPIFRGVGWANQVIASMCNVYYCVIVAWALFYVFSSFSGTLPWELCTHWWNDKLCINKTRPASMIVSDENGTLITTPLDYLVYLASMNISYNDTQTPVEQFWEKRVLKTSRGIDDTGYIQWELCMLLIAVWVFTYFALWKGITRARKMIYVCALSPYILIFILLIRGLTLPGAFDGIGYYLNPRIEYLKKPKVWKDAGTQIFYSFGIGFGTLVALGSYNKYHHNVYKDAIIMCVINSSTSIIAGFVVFSVLGYMANAVNKNIDDVVAGGVGLAFLVYPEAIITLPASQVWSVLFFLMIMILGLDSQVCTVEGVITAMCDQFPLLLRNKKFFVAALCIVNCLLGLTMVTQAGQYWLRLIDHFGASGISLLFVMFFEVVALSWGFGADKIYIAIEDMVGYKPHRIWKYCWKFTAPLTALIIFTFIFVVYQPLLYSDSDRQYPDWAQGLGLLMSLTSMLMIPGYAVYYLITTPGKNLIEKLRKGLTPSDDVREMFEKIREKKIEADLSAIEPVRADCSKTCSRLSLSRLSLAPVKAPLANLSCEYDETGDDYDPRYSPHSDHISK